jgi:hypothetical protein
MANLDNNINASIATDTPPVGKAGFGTVLIVGDGATFSSDRHRLYESAQAASEDTELNTHLQDAVATAFSQSPKPAKVAVAKFDSATDADYAGALTATVDNGFSNFYGITIESRTKADQESAASWALENNRLFIAQSSDDKIKDSGLTTDLASVLKAASNNRAGVIYHATDGEAADVALMTQNLAVDPDSATTLWRYSILRGIAVDDLSSGEISAVKGKNCNVFEEFYGNNVVDEGVLSDGTKIDIRVTIDWCLSRTKEELAQAIVSASNRGSKIPFDDEGFAVIEAKVRDVLTLGEDVGHFIQGSSFVNMPLRSEVTDSDAGNRILRFTFGAVLAGAVEELVVDGTLSVDEDLIANLKAA